MSVVEPSTKTWTNELEATTSSGAAPRSGSPQRPRPRAAVVHGQRRRRDELRDGLRRQVDGQEAVDVGAPRSAVPVPGISAIAVTGFPRGRRARGRSASARKLRRRRSSLSGRARRLRRRRQEPGGRRSIPRRRTGRMTLAKSFDEARPAGESTPARCGSGACRTHPVAPQRQRGDRHRPARAEQEFAGARIRTAPTRQPGSFRPEQRRQGDRAVLRHAGAVGAVLEEAIDRRGRHDGADAVKDVGADRLVLAVAEPGVGIVDQLPLLMSLCRLSLFWFDRWPT